MAVPLQLGSLVAKEQFAPPYTRDVWPWHCPWASLWPAAFKPLVPLPVCRAPSDSCTVPASRMFVPPCWISLWDPDIFIALGRLFCFNSCTSSTVISMEWGVCVELRFFFDPSGVLVVAGGLTLLGITPGATTTVSQGREGELLIGIPVFPASIVCHLGSLPWFWSLETACPASMSHAWSEGMMGTERVRREGGRKVGPLSKWVQGTSVHPFLAAKWESEVLLSRAPTLPLAESHL